MNTINPNLPEPWLRGTHAEVPPVPRAVLHALELAKEDLWKWGFPLSNAQLNERLDGVPTMAFHLRHIARSIDRLLTYAEGRSLDGAQLQLLKSELEPSADHDQLFAELAAAIERGSERVRALGSAELATPRTVGKRQLPTTIGGLLVHVADHTQRHVGQVITTAKRLLLR